VEKGSRQMFIISVPVIVPVGPRVVIDEYSNHSGESGDGLTDTIHKVYRNYEWPYLDRYKKEDCSSILKKTLIETYLDLVDEDYG
jgi:hypothetical protein